MNEKVRAHVMAYALKEGWEIENDKDLVEVITEADEVHSSIESSHRWYDDTWNVVKINGMLIGYAGYHITGDNSMFDMGLEYDLDTFTECKQVEKMCFDYVPIND